MSASNWLGLPGFREAVVEVVEATVPEPDEGFLSAAGAAEYLGLPSRKAVYALVERGKLPCHRPAGRLLFDRRELRCGVRKFGRTAKNIQFAGKTNLRTPHVRQRVDLNRIGSWFADPNDDNFCLGPNSPPTPFDGDGQAGVQAFNSANADPLPAP